jgi:hypothetical protein
MKTLTIKVTLFGCYLGAVLQVWSRPELSGTVALMAKTVLIYCGLIVAAHLCSTLLQIWHWGRNWLRGRSYEPAVTLETEGT